MESQIHECFGLSDSRENPQSLVEHIDEVIVVEAYDFAQEVEGSARLNHVRHFGHS